MTTDSDLTRRQLSEQVNAIKRQNRSIYRVEASRAFYDALVDSFTQATRLQMEPGSEEFIVFKGVWVFPVGSQAEPFLIVCEGVTP